MTRSLLPASALTTTTLFCTVSWSTSVHNTPPPIRTLLVNLTLSAGSTPVSGDGGIPASDTATVGLWCTMRWESSTMSVGGNCDPREGSKSIQASVLGGVISI